MGMYTLLFFFKVTFNDLFVCFFNVFNVANPSIFKCKRVAIVNNWRRIPGFLNELGPFLVVSKKN